MASKTVTVRINREAWHRVIERSFKTDRSFADSLDDTLAELDAAAKQPPAPPPLPKVKEVVKVVGICKYCQREIKDHNEQLDKKGVTVTIDKTRK